MLCAGRMRAWRYRKARAYGGGRAIANTNEYNCVERRVCRDAGGTPRGSIGHSATELDGREAGEDGGRISRNDDGNGWMDLKLVLVPVVVGWPVDEVNRQGTLGWTHLSSGR